MDNAVGLVQAYLRLNGHLTVSEYTVVEAASPREEAPKLVERLIRDGHGLLPTGHKARLVAFGSVTDGGGGYASDPRDPQRRARRRTGAHMTVLRGLTVRRCFPWLYDLVMQAAERDSLARLRRAVVSSACGRTLEIGAGTGLNFRHYRTGTTIVATEPNLAMLAPGARVWGATCQRRARRAQSAPRTCRCVLPSRC